MELTGVEVGSPEWGVTPEAPTHGSRESGILGPGGPQGHRSHVHLSRSLWRTHAAKTSTGDQARWPRSWNTSLGETEV